MPAIHTARVALKLARPLLSLRRDRREWVRKEGQNVDSERYRKNAQKILEAFISLGPVYIKLGQWLSSRADILPQPYMEELAKLQDDVPAAPFDMVRPTIERDLGPIHQIFSYIDPQAISGASLGQVYLAKMGNQDVVVKVKRPGIERMVDEGLSTLKGILPVALRFVDPSLRYSAQAMLAQFIETIGEEMDYTMESSNLKTIRRDMADHPRVIIPDVYDEYSSKDVLTMEYLPGTKVTDIEALDRLGVDRQKLVIDIHRIFFTMLLRNAVFHADPHPGNISVTDDGRIILYDYGMVGRLDGGTRLHLVRLYLALVDRDATRTLNAMKALGMLATGFNRSVIEAAIELSVRAMHGQKPDEMEVKNLMEIANKTMSRFPFVLPKHLALYMRMASIIEGIYKTHRVDFKFVGVLRDILIEEDLIRDAYIEEAKHSIGSLVKSIEAAVGLAPELKRLLDERSRPPKSDALLPGSILSAAMFAGSAIVYGSNEALGVAGMACSLAVMAIFALSRR